MSDVQPANFPNAPHNWTPEEAMKIAAEEGIELTEDHWEELAALQDYFAKHERIVVRELSDALEERFHARGGKRYLFQLFPKGPVAQGCRLAGLEMPAGAIDKGFGSVV